MDQAAIDGMRCNGSAIAELMAPRHLRRAGGRPLDPRAVARRAPRGPAVPRGPDGGGGVGPGRSSSSSSPSSSTGREPALSHQFGVFSFRFRNDWNPVPRDLRGAGRFVAGTLITSAIALVIGVPVAVAAALYVTELCAAAACAARSPSSSSCSPPCPSVVYGLSGILRARAEAQAGRAVVQPTRSRSSRSSEARSPGPNYFHRGPDPRDHDPADRRPRSRREVIATVPRARSRRRRWPSVQRAGR